MGKRSEGKKSKTAQRTRYLLSLGINQVRSNTCPRCGLRCFLVISPKGKRFWVAGNGRVSCPLT